MRIICERSGGFAGLTTKVEVDTTTLPVAQKRELQTLIEQSQLLDQPAKKRKTNIVADGFQYDLLVSTADKEHRVTLDDGTVSEEMSALLAWLMAYRPAKKR